MQTRVSRRILPFAAFCTLFAVTCSIYGSWRCEFLRSDDLTWIRAIQYKPFLAMCSEQFRHGSPNDYRPLTSVALWTESNIFGDAAVPYYGTNFALHTVNALLVVWLVIRFGVSPLWAVLGGLMFLLNPAPFRTIVWVSDIATILQTTFTLGAVHLWLRYLNTHSTAAYFAAAAAAIAAMFSKESGVIAVALLPCLDLLLVGGRRAAQMARRYVPLAAAVTVYLALSLQHIPGWREYPDVYRLSWKMVPNAAYTIGFVAVPVTVLPVVIAAGLILVSLTVFVSRHRRIGLFLAVWMLLAALPTAPFAPGAFETTGRYTYSLLAPASIAACILLECASRIRSRDRRTEPVAFVAAAASGLAVLVVMAVVTGSLARTPYAVRPGVILYHYAVMSLMGYPRAEAFLSSEFPCSSPEQVRVAYRWSEKFIIDRGGRGEFLLPGLLVKAISDTLVRQGKDAERDFQHATDLAADGHVELVRGATVAPERVRALRSRWKNQPACQGIN